MINVPQEIKDLLHQDTCKKNIRIHFIDLERSDICNDLIVKGSVSFKESICSQNNLKFGLCEGSVFECETVGVGYIKGARIRVFCEVYCGNNVSGAVFRPDLQAYVYPIPYGVFTIESCKKQADMNHRKIVAYGGTSNIMNNSVYWNHPGLSASYNFAPNIFNAAMMLSGCTAPLDDAELTELEIHPGGFGVYIPYSVLDSVTVNVICKEYAIDAEDMPDSDLYYCEFTDVLKGIPQVRDELVTGNVYYDEDIQPHITTDLFKIHVGTDGNVNPAPGAFAYIYQQWRSGLLEVPYKIQIKKTEYGTTTILAESQFRDPDEIKIYKVDTSNYPQYNVAFHRDIQDDVNDLWHYDEEKVDFVSLFESVMELEGMFARIDREANKMVFVNLKRQFGLLPAADLYPNTALYPEGVTGGKYLPEDYQSCWYDDCYSKPFGKIRFNYKNLNNEGRVREVYLSGYNAYTEPSEYQIYTVSGNAVIDAKTWTPAQIQDICDILSDSLENISYLPADIVGRGLPYVEAGDTVECLTQSGENITTIVLSKITKGEQNLVDEYKSV